MTEEIDVKYVHVGEELSNRPFEESAATVAGKDPEMLATAHIVTDLTTFSWNQLRQMIKIW